MTDTRVADARLEFTGGSRQLWFVRLRGEAEPNEVVLRVDSGTGAFSGSPYSLAREAAVYRALAHSAVPIPHLLAARDDALLLERAAGSSRLDDRSEAEAAGLLDSFMAAIAALHRLDAGTLDLPGFARPATAGEGTRTELAAWRRLAAGSNRPPDPLVAYAFAWLDAHAPSTTAQPRLVQGDTGPGNFVADGTRVTGLVDWELSHLGDPMDDIAWIDHRCQGLAGPFGDPAQRDRSYQAASGAAIDSVAVQFYAVLVRLRCLVTTDLTIGRGGGALGLVVYVPPHHRFREELALALLDVLGTAPVPVAPPAAAPTPLAEFDDHAIAGLREVVLPACPSPDVKLRARAALLTLEHHRAREQFGAALDEAEADDRRATLGRTVDDAGLVTLAADAGALGDTQMLDLLHRGAQRARWCWNVPSARPAAAVVPPHRPSSDRNRTDDV